MAGTGVLPFIRGIDLTLNDLENDRFPEAMEDMTSLRWLRLTDTKLKTIPQELNKLSKLEHLTLKRNNVSAIQNGDLSALKCLRTLNLSKNDLGTTGVPLDIFDNEELNTHELPYELVLDELHQKYSHVYDMFEWYTLLLPLYKIHLQFWLPVQQLFLRQTKLKILPIHQLVLLLSSYHSHQDSF